MNGESLFLMYWKKLECVNTSRRCGKSRDLGRETLEASWIDIYGSSNGKKAFGVPLVIKKGEEPKKYDFFEDTFLTMCKLARENGIWWIGSGENRRRDDDGDAPEVEAEDEDEGNKDDFDWEAMIDEDEAQGSPELHDEIPAEATPSSAQQKDKDIAGVDPSGPSSREAEFLKFQAEFERKRANRFHDDLEKAKAENARLLALLHQAQTKPHP
ncbi:hypothetical protein Dimus_003184 [Dionaea muscipula]